MHNLSKDPGMVRHVKNGDQVIVANTQFNVYVTYDDMVYLTTVDSPPPGTITSEEEYPWKHLRRLPQGDEFDGLGHALMAREEMVEIIELGAFEIR